MNSTTIYYGIEMEFCAPHYCLINLPNGWIIKEEFQHHIYPGYSDDEINSPIFRMFPMEELVTVCNLLKKTLSAHIHRKCGVHIHFSGKEINEKEVTEKLLKYNFPWECRKYFCSLSSFQTKYVPLRLVDITDHHYECRLFNGSLNPRAIHNYWKVLNRVIGE